MKIHEIREMKAEELRQRIDEEEKNLVDLRFAHELKQLSNTAKLNIIKKDIAKMRTVMKEREIAENKTAGKDKKKGAIV